MSKKEIKDICIWLVNKLRKYKCKDIINHISILNIVTIVFYYIDTMKHLIKTIVLIFSNEQFVKLIYEIYSKNILFFCKIWMVIYLIHRFISYVKNKYKTEDKPSDKDKLDEYFDDDEIIFKKLEDYIYKNQKRCFVLEGEWGSGKTSTINRFIYKFSLKDKRNIYRVSCFGIDSRATLLNELKQMFEKNDKSFKRYSLNIIKKIPLIGDFLEEILKSDYEFKDIKQGSIFIFDDFERANVPNYYNEKIDIKNLERFNVIAGLINELIEQYNMKVIVLCSKKEISSDFYYDIFQYKMESYIYHKKIKAQGLTRTLFYRCIYAQKNVMENGIERHYIPISKENIERFIVNYSTFIDDIFTEGIIENIRVLIKTIATFIDIIDELEFKQNKPEYIYEEEYISIFYTLLITNIYKYKYKDEGIKTLNKIEKGTSLMDLFNKINIKDDSFKEYQTLRNIIGLYDFGGGFTYREIFKLEEKDMIYWCGTEIAENWDKGIHKLREFHFGHSEFVPTSKDKERAEIMHKYILKEETPKFNERLKNKKDLYFLEDLIFILSDTLKHNRKDTSNIKEEILKILKNCNINIYGKNIMLKPYNAETSIKEVVKDICSLYKIEEDKLITDIIESLNENEFVKNSLSSCG